MPKNRNASEADCILGVTKRGLANSRIFWFGNWAGFLLPGQFLSPIVKESYDAGVPLTPMISGIPIVIIVADVIVVLLFFGKYVKYLFGSAPMIN